MVDVSKYASVPDKLFKSYADEICDYRVQPRWDIPEAFSVQAAPANGFISQSQNPNQPLELETFRAHAEACIAAGVTSVHFHVMENGRPSGHIELTRQLIKPLQAKYGDRIVWDGSVASGKNLGDGMKPIAEGLVEVAIVKPGAVFFGDSLSAWNPPWVKAQVDLIQQYGGKPKIAVHDTGYVDFARRHLLETGLLRRPSHWMIAVGMPGCGTLWDPISATETLTMLVRRIKEADPTAVIQVGGGGRAHFHLTALAILLGLDGVRVGMEDAIYRFPHRDDMLESTVEVVEQTIRLVHEMGRRVATAAEYRQAIGLPVRTA